MNHKNVNLFSECLIQYCNSCKNEEQTQCILFITKIYEKSDEFFYTNDMKVLIDIMIRMLETASTIDTINIVLKCLLVITCCKSYELLKKYKTVELAEVVNNVGGHEGVDRALTE